MQMPSVSVLTQYCFIRQNYYLLWPFPDPQLYLNLFQILTQRNANIAVLKDQTVERTFLFAFNLLSMKLCRPAWVSTCHYAELPRHLRSFVNHSVSNLLFVLCYFTHSNSPDCFHMKSSGSFQQFRKVRESKCD